MDGWTVRPADGRRADLAKMKLVVWWKREVDGRRWSDGGWFWVLLNYLVEVPKNPQSQHIPADDGRFWFTRGAGTAGTAVTGGGGGCSAISTQGCLPPKARCGPKSEISLDSAA